MTTFSGRQAAWTRMNSGETPFTDKGSAPGSTSRVKDANLSPFPSTATDGNWSKSFVSYVQGSEENLRVLDSSDLLQLVDQQVALRTETRFRSNFLTTESAARPP